MDGFMKGPSSGGSNLHPKRSHKITESSNLISAKPIANRLKSTAQNVHQRAQRSQTLMRSVVRKPEAKQPALQAHSNVLKKHTNSVDPKKLSHAQATTQ